VNLSARMRRQYIAEFPSLKQLADRELARREVGAASFRFSATSSIMRALLR
jgi:hypothetical protein